MLRASAVVAILGALAALPLAAALWLGLGPGTLLRAGAAGLVAAVGAVGWVLVPQIALAIAVLSLALHQLSARIGGLAPQPTPAWLEPAVESALLLGLLGTISGMVSGFVSLNPEQLEPGPLLDSLGRALRSSFVGFLIALVGVWSKAHPSAPAPGAPSPA